MRRISLIACLALSIIAPAQSTQAQSATSPSQRAAIVFDAAKKSPLTLRAFLTQMPKGADLHLHLSGAVYAESLLQQAAVDNLCVNTDTSTLTPNAGLTRSIPPQPLCAAGQQPAANAFKDQRLYDALIDAFSMRSFVPSAGVSAHDQFFAAFDRFDALGNTHAAEWLDEVATRAAAQNEQYLEVMLTPPFANAAKLGRSLHWPEGGQGDSPEQLAKLRDSLLSAGLRSEIAADRAQLDGAESARRQREHCGQPDAALACTVTIRYLYQILRQFPPQQVFAQTLLGFEVAAADLNVVGINFVQPEDAYLSMSEYHRQMLMLEYLHSVYPQVHLSLHAGELAPGLVPPKGLSFHIREAVELAHAERIGHGVDVMYEASSAALLKEMAAKHIMVEINLTSNDVILGVKAPEHPFLQYRAAHVPVALSTDDEGVSRIDLTNEYTRAALEFNLSYAQLKDLARTSLEHSFLPGESLWQQPDTFTAMRSSCAMSSTTPTPACAAFLKTSERAAQQWELERRYRIFESNLR